MSRQRNCGPGIGAGCGGSGAGSGRARIPWLKMMQTSSVMNEMRFFIVNSFVEAIALPSVVLCQLMLNGHVRVLF